MDKLIAELQTNKRLIARLNIVDTIVGFLAVCLFFIFIRSIPLMIVCILSLGVVASFFRREPSYTVLSMMLDKMHLKTPENIIASNQVLDIVREHTSDKELKPIAKILRKRKLAQFYSNAQVPANYDAELLKIERQKFGLLSDTTSGHVSAAKVNEGNTMGPVVVAKTAIDEVDANIRHLQTLKLSQEDTAKLQDIIRDRDSIKQFMVTTKDMMHIAEIRTQVTELVDNCLALTKIMLETHLQSIQKEMRVLNQHMKSKKD